MTLKHSSMLLNCVNLLLRTNYLRSWNHTSHKSCCNLWSNHLPIAKKLYSFGCQEGNVSHLWLVEDGSSKSRDRFHFVKNSLDLFIVRVHDPEGRHVDLVVLEVLQVEPIEIGKSYLSKMCWCISRFMYFTISILQRLSTSELVHWKSSLSHHLRSAEWIKSPPVVKVIKLFCRKYRFLQNNKWKKFAQKSKKQCYFYAKVSSKLFL